MEMAFPHITYIHQATGTAGLCYWDNFQNQELKGDTDIWLTGGHISLAEE